MRKKRRCCSSSKHPEDFGCKWFGQRERCSIIIQRVGFAGPIAHTAAQVRDEGAEVIDREETEQYEPGSDWLIGFFEALDLAETEPSTAQLLTLAQVLLSEGFYDDALQVGKYLEHRLLEAPSDFLVRAYEVQLEAYQAMDDQAAVEAVRQLSDHVKAVMQNAAPNR